LKVKVTQNTHYEGDVHEFHPQRNWKFDLLYNPYWLTHELVSSSKELKGYLHSRQADGTFYSFILKGIERYLIPSSDNSSFSISGFILKGIESVDMIHIFHKSPKSFILKGIERRLGQRVLWLIYLVSSSKELKDVKVTADSWYQNTSFILKGIERSLTTPSSSL